MQPFFPAVAFIDALPEYLGHIRELCYLALCVQFLLEFFELSQRIVLVHRELRTYVRCTHTCLRIVLRVLYIVAVVTLDITAIRTYFGCQVACYLRIKEGRVQVRTYLTYDEARPYIVQTYLMQPGFEALQEGVKRLLVCQTTVYLFRTYLVRDRRDVMCLTEVLGVLDQFYRTFNNHMDIDDLALRQEDIYRRIDVNQVIARQDSSLIALFYAVHRTLSVPTLDALFVLQPRTSVIDSHYVRTGVVHCCGFAGQDLRECLLRHAGVTTVAVYLVQRRCEIDRRVVTFRGTERCFDHRQGVRTCCKQRHRHSRHFLSLLHHLEYMLCLFHLICVLKFSLCRHDVMS